MKTHGQLLCMASLMTTSFSFQIGLPFHQASGTASFHKASIVETDEESSLTNKGLFKRDCYVATNRFAVRKNQQAVFEKRWATRKSRLAVLPGFRYFHLMRRVTEDGTYDEGDSDETSMENYVSFTIWDKKSDFSAWRKGDAFKEAHGGTSVVSFLSTMVNSAFVLRGAPRPAFYDGLFLDYKPVGNSAEVVDGWRNVKADGINTLPAECYVRMVKYFIGFEEAPKFEAAWNEVNGGESSVQGVISRSLLRRDGQAKGHGVTPMDATEPSYVATTVFQDKESFQSYKDSEEDLSSHSMKKPQTVLYEGTLMLTPSSK